MGVAVKGGQWCPQCERQVAGQKTTHRASGAAWLGATGLPRPGETPHCPSCGGNTFPDSGPGRRMVYDDAGKLTFDSKRDGVQAPPMDTETVVFWVLVAVCAVLAVIAFLSGGFTPNP